MVSWDKQNVIEVLSLYSGDIVSWIGFDGVFFFFWQISNVCAIIEF